MTYYWSYVVVPFGFAGYVYTLDEESKEQRAYVSRETFATRGEARSKALDWCDWRKVDYEMG